MINQLISKNYVLFVVIIVSMMTNSAIAEEWDYRGNAELETMHFIHDAAYVTQDDSNSSSSLLARPEISYQLNNDDRFLIDILARVDSTDDNRTHNDLREFNYLHVGDDIELTFGLSRVFWGVTESRHLIDIINQTDFVENINGEEKLGQPMLNVKYIQDWGTLSGFVLLGFRDRIFPDSNARLSGPLPIDSKNPTYESDEGDQHIDIALRWSNTYDDWDVGVTGFQGTSRDPRLLFIANGGNSYLQPHYDQIKQVGFDLQYTGETVLWKLESIAREGNNDNFFAVVGGFEYTYYSVMDSTIDIGVIFEYLYDGRDQALSPVTNLDDDIALGVRAGFNDTQDTQILAVLVVDRDTQTTLINIEAERRLSESLKVSLAATFFTKVDSNDVFSSFQSDDHVTAKLAFYF